MWARFRAQGASDGWGLGSRAPRPPEAEEKSRWPGLGVLGARERGPLSQSLFPAPNPASTAQGGPRARGGELRPAPPRTPGQQDREQRGERPRGAAERGATPAGPPRPARLRGRAGRPTIGEPGANSTTWPARRPGPRVPGDSRPRQGRRDLPGDGSSRPPAQPAGRDRSRRPDAPRPCPPAPAPAPPRAALPGRFRRPLPGAPGRGRHSPEAAAAPRRAPRGSLCEGARRPSSPAPSRLVPPRGSAASARRTPGHGRAGVGRLSLRSPPPPPPPPEFGALLQCLRGWLWAPRSPPARRRRAPPSAAEPPRPVPPLGAPRHSALRPSFLTLFSPALPLSPGPQAAARGPAARGSAAVPSVPRSCSRPALPRTGRGLPGPGSGGPRAPGEQGPQRPRRPLGAWTAPPGGPGIGRVTQAKGSRWGHSLGARTPRVPAWVLAP